MANPVGQAVHEPAFARGAAALQAVMLGEGPALAGDRPAASHFTQRRGSHAVRDQTCRGACCSMEMVSCRPEAHLQEGISHSAVASHVPCQDH